MVAQPPVAIEAKGWAQRGGTLMRDELPGLAEAAQVLRTWAASACLRLVKSRRRQDYRCRGASSGLGRRLPSVSGSGSATGEGAGGGSSPRWRPHASQLTSTVPVGIPSSSRAGSVRRSVEPQDGQMDRAGSGLVASPEGKSGSSMRVLILCSSEIDMPDGRLGPCHAHQSRARPSMTALPTVNRGLRGPAGARSQVRVLSTHRPSGQPAAPGCAASSVPRAYNVRTSTVRECPPEDSQGGCQPSLCVIEWKPPSCSSWSHSAWYAIRGSARLSAPTKLARCTW